MLERHRSDGAARYTYYPEIAKHLLQDKPSRFVPVLPQALPYNPAMRIAGLLLSAAMATGATLDDATRQLSRDIFKELIEMWNGVDWLLKNHRNLIDAEFVLNADPGGVTTMHAKPLNEDLEASEKQYARRSKTRKRL